jgi:hypothetical protein
VGDVDEQVDDDEDGAGPDGESHHRVVVGAQDRVDGVGADARPVEHRLRHHRAGEQDAEQEADLRHRRGERGAQDVLPDDQRPRQPHGALVEDEVRLHDVEDAGTREPHERGERGKRQRSGGQGQMLKRGTERGPIPREHRIDEVETRDASWREALQATVEGRPPEPHCEEQLQHDAEPEAGDGEPRDGDDAQGMVEQGVAPERGQNAERNADQYGNDHGHHGELDGGGQAVQQIVHDRPPGEEAGAHVTTHQPRDVVDELHRQRPVVPEVAPQRLDLRRRRRLPSHERHRVRRNDPRDDERHHQQSEQGGQEPDEPVQREREEPHGSARPRRSVTATSSTTASGSPGRCRSG